LRIEHLKRQNLPVTFTKSILGFDYGAIGTHCQFKGKFGGAVRIGRKPVSATTLPKGQLLAFDRSGAGFSSEGCPAMLRGAKFGTYPNIDGLRFRRRLQLINHNAPSRPALAVERAGAC
jgi:hypothetical protein